jgi:hypothetical protein
MNKARLIQLIMASVLAIAFILSAEGLMCRAFSQQLRSEPSVPIHSPGPDLWILVLNSADGPPFSKPDETGIIDLVLKEAFRRVGIEISIIAVPAERALRNAGEGIEDGTFSRIAGRKMFLYLNRKHAGLVAPISESLRRMKEDGTYQIIVGCYTQP